MNGLHLSRVFVTKFLGVHMDSKLDWNYHIDIVINKVAKHVSVMNRVTHVLTSSALYSMYCTLVMPYLTYCCEVWGNNYKTRIQSLFILQRRAIIICLNTNYKCHTKPLFYQLRSLNVFDIIYLNSLVFMYKAFHNLLPTNLLSYFKKVNLTFHSPFLTISLCRAGQYLSHPVFSVLCHVFSQSVFLHVSLYVVPPSLSRSASAPSPRDL